MKYRVFVIAMIFAANVASAANGDLIVNGNLGVGTNTPAAKAEVNGNMIVDGNLGVGTSAPSEKAEINGNLKVDGNLCVGGNCPSTDQNINGNLCVGGKCTSTLHVSGGLYGYCITQAGYYGPICITQKNPASCVQLSTVVSNCSCPSDYNLVQIGENTAGPHKYYACFKN